MYHNFEAALLVMIAIAMLPSIGFCDLSVTVSCGNGFSNLGNTVTYGNDTISASQKLVADPRDGTMGNHFDFQGSLHGASSTYTDTQGNQVYLYRTVSGTQSTFGSWDWSITSDPSGNWVQGELWLNAFNAKLIKAESSAVNYKGDNARSTATISSVSAISNLDKFYTKAYADQYITSTAQSAASAKGDTINFDTYARNKEGDMAESYTSATNGEVKSYSARAYSEWYEAYAELDKNMQANVPSGSIIQNMYAIKYDLASPKYSDNSESDEYLKSGYMQTKSAKGAGYIDKAYASKYYDLTYAYSSADFNLNPKGVAYSFASYSNRPIGGSLSQLVYSSAGISSFNALGLTGPGQYKNIVCV